MKQASVVATVILAAAVLLAAYAIGRLIKQARLGEPSAPQEQVAEANDVNEADVMTRVGRSRGEPTPEERARLKEERAAALAQRDNLTDEEKEKLREEMRQKLRTRRGEPGQVPQLSHEEFEALAKRWPEMSEEEREQAKAAFRARMRGGRRPGLRRPAPAREPNAETPTAEPNAAGPD
jgi:hypothetical protein